MKYAFLAENQSRWPVSVLCEVMQVSRSGFYAYQRRQARPVIDSVEGALLARVKAIAAETRASYGSRRMAKQLQDDGFAVGRFKARRLMQEAGVRVRRAKPRGPITTESRHGYGIADNVLARHFDVAKPDQAWAGDITYIWTAEGWLYVSVLLDLYSRKVVGWAMSSHIDTALVQDALTMALGRRQPAAGLLHHSDRGSQYASHAYQDFLSAHGIVCSMSDKGECLDNAVAERFFGSVKREWTSHCEYATRQEAKADIIAYIEMFYNSRRKHSYLGLPRRHVENYFLDEDVLAEVATQFCLDSCWRKPQNISTVIHEVAATVQEIALIHHLKEYTRLNSQLPGPTIRDIEKKTSAQLLDELKMHFHDPLSALVQRFSPENLERLFHEQKVALKRDLLNGQWKESFPGKLVFQRFCGDKLKCATERVREAYLDIALRNKPVVFQDILNIFSHFDTVV